MDIVRELRYDSKPKEWLDGLQWLGWSAILGLMPIWTTAFLFRCFNQEITLKTITGNGEFALYAASFLGTCFYIVARDFRKRGYPSRGTILMILTTLLLFSVFIYAIAFLVTFVDIFHKTAPALQHLDRDFLVTISVCLLPFVCLITYLLIVADNVRATADLTAMAKRDYEDLENEFDKLGEN